MRIAGLISLAALLSGVASSQSATAQAAFVAADVHVSPHTSSPFPYMKGPFVRGGVYEIRTATMLDLVAKAYGIGADKVVGGPSWLEMDRFDAIAKLPPGSTPEMRKAMLQGLLADRFRLVVHNDTKPLPAYALTVGKRPALKQSDGSGETGCKFTRATPGPQTAGSVAAPPPLLYSCHNMTMAAFAEGMRNMVAAFQYIGENLVADQTGLSRNWLSLRWGWPRAAVVFWGLMRLQRGRSGALSWD